MGEYNPMKVAGPKIASEPHGVAATEGTVCHGCEALSCIAQRSRLEPWRFYCSKARRRVSPGDVRRCPHRDAGEAGPSRERARYALLRGGEKVLEGGIEDIALAMGVLPRTVENYSYPCYKEQRGGYSRMRTREEVVRLG